MNHLRRSFSNIILQKNNSSKSLIPLCSKTRLCHVTTNMSSEDVPRMHLEKSINHVTLLGRVGIDPQLRGTESKPVVVFTLATNTNYKYETEVECMLRGELFIVNIMIPKELHLLPHQLLQMMLYFWEKLIGLS
ncbi:unnamed protein product [Larinioides sclopetarius]|uniref:Single-stranded DNA binding protein n=1 Tax=Larinioides sclopetarius TaxID=280406 RepID=A0AAV2BC16_9ARAC